MRAILAWRLCSENYAEGAFTGEGSFRYGRRWNPRGTRVAYCSESRSLAALEVLANVEETTLLKDTRWFMISVAIPSECIERPDKFPENWRAFPHPPSTQSFGARWIADGRHGALRVPSTIVAGEFNYLLNPAHPDFQRMTRGTPESFRFDARIV